MLIDQWTLLWYSVIQLAAMYCYYSFLVYSQCLLKEIMLANTAVVV